MGVRRRLSSSSCHAPRRLRRSSRDETSCVNPEARHGCAGARPSDGGCGGPYRGPPRRSMSERPIPNAVPHLAGNEWRYLKECLDTNWVSSIGPFVDRFEREMAAYVGARHGVAVVTGTAALHAALIAAGVGADDDVTVPSLTFMSTANAIRY